MDKNWQNDPRLADMDKSKLEMLQNLAEQGTGKNASDMLPFLMNAASRGKSRSTDQYAGSHTNASGFKRIIEKRRSYGQKLAK